MSRIVLIDLSQRELQLRSELSAEADRLRSLKAQAEKPGSGLLFADAQQLRLTELEVELDSDSSVDPMYRAVAMYFDEDATRWSEVQDKYLLKYGLFNSQSTPSPKDHLLPEEREIAGICGLLELDGLTDAVQSDYVVRVNAAKGEYKNNRKLFEKVFDYFEKKGSSVDLQSQHAGKIIPLPIVAVVRPTPTLKALFHPNSHIVAAQARKLAGPVVRPKPLVDEPEVSSALKEETVLPVNGRSVAQVVRRLASDRVTANDPYLSVRIEAVFESTSGGSDGAAPSSIEIDLPDLEATVDQVIVKENLEAIQAIYYTYMLEETRIFQVVERIVELFRQGLLPLGTGSSGDYRFNYYKMASERLTENERRDLYLRLFGAPGGSATGLEPNRDFNELWLRFVSAVSSFARSQNISQMLLSKTPAQVSQETLRKAGRDLGANLSRNGYGMAYFAATDMQKSIVQFRDLLQDASLRNAFGARDMWQVIDFVNVNYLGGARNSYRYRTQARAGAVIIRWISDHVQRLSNVTGPVLAADQIFNPQARDLASSSTPMKNPSDWDLVNACDQWLAVGGVQDQAIEQYSQPIESPVTTSRPIEMPRMAREAFDTAGINLPGM